MQIKEELVALKKVLELDDSLSLIVDYTRILCALRDIEFKEAIQWRMKSGIKWAMLGDSPLVFFFLAMNKKRK